MERRHWSLTAALLALWCSFAMMAAQGSALPGVVTNWGDTSTGLANIPSGLLTNVMAVACGLSHNLALKSNGTVVAWGAGTIATGVAPDYGQSIIPNTLATLFVTSIAAGKYHSLALASNGNVVAWGYNGDGETVIPSSVKNIIAVAAGSLHNLAVTSNGTVIAWGYNGSGQTNVPAGLSGVVAVAGGDVHSLALQSNGNVVAWGNNSFGQTNIPAGLSNVIAIAAGQDHNLALRADGTVAAWGFNGSGETNVPTGLSNVVAIAAGGHQSVAITANGAITAWGAISNFPAGLTNVSTAAAGGAHGLAVTLNPLLLSQPPASLLLAQGVNTNLTVTVWSGSAFSAQWSFDGTPLAGATNLSLAITNFSATNAGIYTVTVSNAYNFVTARSVLRLSNSPAIYVNGVDVGGGTVTNIDSVQITMTNTGTSSVIYYTLDGSNPDFTSIQYSGVFLLTNSAIINAIAYNSSFTLSFSATPIAVQITPTYSLSATTPGGGSIAASPAPVSGSNYVSNAVVTLTATPSNGWSFIGWTGDSTATTNGITLTMNSRHSVQAVFGSLLNLTTNGNGQLQFNPANGPYPYGSTVQITAMPAAGFYFFGWAGLLSGSSDPVSIVVNNTNPLTALFGNLTSNKVSLLVFPVGGGIVTVNPSTNVYTNGQTVTLTAVSTSNTVFSNWSGSITSVSNPLATVLNGSEIIYANFVSGSPTNPPTITAPPLSRTLAPGSSTTLSFQASGSSPLTYQWYFNGSIVSGATAASLNLTHVAASQAGFYKVVVTGSGGSVTSTPASVALFSLMLTPSESQSFPLLILNSVAGATYQLQYSANLSTDWSVLDTMTLQDSTFYYIDSATSNSPVRFYRAVPQ